VAGLIGHALVVTEELLPVGAIVKFEEEAVLLHLRGHGGAVVSNGSGGDRNIGRRTESPLPSWLGIAIGLLVFGGRCRGNGRRRKEQVGKCGVEPHSFSVWFVLWFCFGSTSICLFVLCEWFNRTN